MVWTEQKYAMMLTAVAGESVFHTKPGSRERGSAWQAVADSLNCHANEFNVSQRSVRDRFNVLVKKVKASFQKKKEKVEVVMQTTVR